MMMIMTNTDKIQIGILHKNTKKTTSEMYVAPLEKTSQQQNRTEAQVTYLAPGSPGSECDPSSTHFGE